MKHPDEIPITNNQPNNQPTRQTNKQTNFRPLKLVISHWPLLVIFLFRPEKGPCCDALGCVRAGGSCRVWSDNVLLKAATKTQYTLTAKTITVAPHSNPSTVEWGSRPLVGVSTEEKHIYSFDSGSNPAQHQDIPFVEDFTPSQQYLKCHSAQHVNDLTNEICFTFYKSGNYCFQNWQTSTKGQTSPIPIKKYYKKIH